MKKLIVIVMVSLFGCNYGNSLANDGLGGSGPASNGGSSSSGGSEDHGTGGHSEDGTGGSTSAGGATGGTSSSSGGSASGGSAKSGGNVGSGGSNASGGSSSAGGATSAGGSSANGGSVSAGGTTGTGGASSSGGATGTGGSTSACVPAATPAKLAQVHNPGKDCIACHGSGVPTTIGGTVYDKAGTTAVSGATVTITGNDGKVLTLVTASNGNFWSNTAVAFPAKVEVSKCPDTAKMITSVSNGSCNSCHRSGGSTVAIHLP